MIECPRCSAQNDASQRFCGSCGAELAASTAGSGSSEASRPDPAGSAGGLSSTQMADLPASDPSSTEVPGGGSSPESSLVEGQVISNRYEIRRLIGLGGMGAVYAAHDRNRDKEIALKVLLPRLLSSEQARERFVNEGRVASELSHPGIVNVFDVQESEGLSFLTMELLEGRTLREEIEARKEAGAQFGIDEVVRTGTALCEALEYAHRFTVHRDVKPENIFLCADGSVKLMDFGIARLMSTSELTMTGMALGTAYYMAPEQLKGAAEVDERADQYSVGVVLYELLTGEVPTGRARSAREVRKDVPPGLSSAIDRALDAKAEERFGDIGELARALASGDSKSTRQAGEGARSLVRLLGALVLVLVSVSLGAAWMNEHRRAEEAGAARQAQVAAEAGERERAEREAARGFRSASLVVRSNVSGDRVLIDGRLVGPTGPDARQLEPGRHVIRVEKDGYEPFEETVELQGGESLTMTARLRSLRPLAGPDMVVVPGGSFFMGCNASVDSDCDASEEPGRVVNVGPFAIDRTEVTVEAYGECVRSGPCSPSGLKAAFTGGKAQAILPRDCNWRRSGRENHPINCVTWDEARVYCEWRGKRLPTETEWEKAARGTDGRKYPWGNTSFVEAGHVANIADETAKRSNPSWAVAKGYDDGYETTAPVGSFPNGASPYGALDMIGNVWEWNSSWLPGGRSVRGGSWHDVPRSARASRRHWLDPARRHRYYGFRCAQ